ncbi:MAG: hypothetical protein U0900_18590 [Myxococcota bacterium]
MFGLVLAVGLAGQACRAEEPGDANAAAAEAGAATAPATAGAAPAGAPAGGAAPAAADEAARPETWHATAFVSGIGSYRIIHYWSKGPSMRAETLIAGHPITTIVHDDRYIVIDRLAGKALDVERSKRAISEDRGRARPFAFEQKEIRDAGGEKVEDTNMSGVPVEVWRVTDDAGRRTAWVSKGEPSVPLRVETFVRGGSQTVKIDYSSWGFNLEMPDAFFELPDGLEVERLSYEAFTKKSAEGPVGPAPILYPDMLHGSKPQ